MNLYLVSVSDSRGRRVHEETFPTMNDAVSGLYLEMDSDFQAFADTAQGQSPHREQVAYFFGLIQAVAVADDYIEVEAPNGFSYAIGDGGLV